MRKQVVEWRHFSTPVPYDFALAEMPKLAESIRSGTAPEQVWLLEHPPLYTAGTSADPKDLRDPDRFPVFNAGRGGQYTYHGPGQRVCYVMLDLNRQGRDVRAFVKALESWLIDALAQFGVKGEIRDSRVGVWVARPDLGDDREDKIAAIGIRVRRWVSYHGISLNVSPNLEHYTGIVPCGIAEHGVTSLHDLGISATMRAVDDALKTSFEHQFGATTKVLEFD